ncbi:MAG: heme peroxidase [Phycisphaerales bacterium]|nr:heme peroxidase [Phycisphaerales bacterium]
MATNPSKRVVSFSSAKVVEQLESRLLRSSDVPINVRSIDGTGNNLTQTDWGSANTALIRLAAAEYGDGLSTPAGAARASARAISNAVAAQDTDEEILSAAHLSSFAYLWGQFIDHDMDLTTTSVTNGTLNIAVPAGDPSFDPTSTGTQVIPLSRSTYITDANGVRQQVNSITAYIDGSQVYGSDATRAAALRTFSGGLMKTSAGDLLPFNTDGLANANDAHIFASGQLFLAGDVRANENSELTALQTLFVREHNRLAKQIAAKHTSWTDEQIYQQARKLVIGEIQNITYNEYLPALLGQTAIKKYSGYKATVNAGISNEFSTAAFRLGHSQLANDVEFINNDGTDAAEPLSLAEVFFNPTVVETHGIDSTMKYLASSNAEEIDSKVVTSLRNFLFGAPGSGGLDLASLNIQRGRDHGLASYNDTRAAMGLAKVTRFEQISSDPAVVAELKSVYKTVNDIDLWVGGLAEDHVAGSSLGQTFQKIVVDQFTRTRDGDRFYFENYLTGADLAQVKSTSLADIIQANTGVRNIQANVFVFNATVSGTIYADRNGNGHRDLRESGAANITINLLDDTGAIEATTVTDSAGRYMLSGVQLGDYTVVPVLPTGSKATTAKSIAMHVSKSQAFNNYDFGLTGTTPVLPPPPPGPTPPPPPPAHNGGPMQPPPPRMNGARIADDVLT